jgi:molecular chaperone DnaK
LMFVVFMILTITDRGYNRDSDRDYGRESNRGYNRNQDGNRRHDRNPDSNRGYNRNQDYELSSLEDSWIKSLNWGLSPSLGLL